MARMAVGVTIARPIEEVFAVLTDVERTGTWFPGQVEEHWTSPPPHGLGSTRHAIITTMGRRSENDATVLEFDPPRRGVMGGETQGVAWTGAFDFTPDGDDTRVNAAFEFTAGGPMRLLVGVFLRWYRGQWKRGLANLKRKMEAGEL
jgi:uncharacterized protein YndB with AHSA1/START domain